MPFTPFHFGHSLPFFLTDMKKKRIDVIASFFGSIIVDLESIIIILFSMDLPLHGLFHSFFFATILGLVLGGIIHLTEPFWQKILKIFEWKQKTSLLNKVICCVIMANFHVFLDAILYKEMNPWFFISGNPFFGLFNQEFVYYICTIGIIIGIIEYLMYIIWKTYQKNTN